MSQLELNLLQPQPEYCTISLTQGQVALVDPEDFTFLNQWNWQARWNKETRSFYASRTVTINGKKSIISMHRLIMQAPDGIEVDHIFHVTLDNRKSQLRLATPAQNQYNSIDRRKKGPSGFTGVCWRHGAFIARITINGKRVSLGSFQTAELAAAAYEAAAAQTRGEFHNPQTQPAETFAIKAKGGIRRDNTTGYLGVSYDKKRKRFYAQIRLKPKANQTHIGYFFTAEAAHRAYQEAVAKRDAQKLSE
jgi:hypothetical protein